MGGMVEGSTVPVAGGSTRFVPRGRVAQMTAGLYSWRVARVIPYPYAIEAHVSCTWDTYVEEPAGTDVFPNTITAPAWSEDEEQLSHGLRTAKLPLVVL